MCPGKLCSGSQTNNAGNLKNSRAFCEGRTARGNDLTMADNPHEAGNEAHIAWNRGWFIVDQQAPFYVGEHNCCSAVGDVGGTPTDVRPFWEASIPSVDLAQGAAWTINLNDYIAYGTTPFTFAIDTGALPPGVTLNTDGTFAGTITNADGAGDATFIATNAGGDSDQSPTLHWTIVTP